MLSIELHAQPVVTFRHNRFYLEKLGPVSRLSGAAVLSLDQARKIQSRLPGVLHDVLRCYYMEGGLRGLQEGMVLHPFEAWPLARHGLVETLPSEGRTWGRLNLLLQVLQGADEDVRVRLTPKGTAYMMLLPPVRRRMSTRCRVALERAVDLYLSTRREALTMPLPRRGKSELLEMGLIEPSQGTPRRVRLTEEGFAEGFWGAER